ncbi:MAG: dienelactone hydrolase family protein [Pseudomonadota bacterium]
MSILFSFPSVVGADLIEQMVYYEHDDAELRGFVYFDDATKHARPGVLVVHEWWGLNDYAKRRARELANLGYVAFAIDMYGVGKLALHPQQAGEWHRAVIANEQFWRARVRTAHDLLAAHPLVDAERTAAIGYCFGGATVLQLAYSGAPVAGVVSFHGGLPILKPGQGQQVKAKILVQHGAEDPFVPASKVAAFQAAMTAADLDWRLDSYPGARHSFTVKGAGERGMDALAYNAQADQKSWVALQQFLSGIFKE